MKIYTDNEKEEILDALETIKNVCVSRQNCEGCPLGDDDRCALMANPPCDWTIRNQNEWKALE